MNVDRRMLSPVPSMDSGSEGEENLRISRNLSTHTQYLEVELWRRLISFYAEFLSNRETKYFVNYRTQKSEKVAFGFTRYFCDKRLCFSINGFTSSQYFYALQLLLDLNIPFMQSSVIISTVKWEILFMSGFRICILLFIKNGSGFGSSKVRKKNNNKKNFQKVLDSDPEVQNAKLSKNLDPLCSVPIGLIFYRERAS